jgi:uncharacterized protein (DUF2225 family)
MTTVHQEKVQCPCCKTSITIDVLGSTNSFGCYTDFHGITMGYAPLPIMMNTCPNCGFSGYRQDFSGKLDKNLKSQIGTVITPLCQAEEMNAGRRYELHAKIREMAGDNAWKLGQEYLKGAWAAFDEQTANEAHLRQLAINYFQKALAEQLVPPNEEPNITYLIGELYRRIGEIEAAHRYFNQVIQQAETTPSWQDMAKYAIQQRDNPQEEMSSF